MSETPNEVIDPETLLPFRREYVNCDECQGWTERWRGFEADVATNSYHPTSVVLRGRLNHARTCTKESR